MLIPRQHKIIRAGIVCLGLTVSFPPWIENIGHRTRRYGGYRFLFTAHETNRVLTIDLPRFLIPVAFVVCATIAAFVLTREKSLKQG
jgi:hypothetical protein